MRRILLLIIMCLILSSCTNSTELDYLRMTNGSGAAEYFGPWINFFRDYLFWIYAIVFILPTINRGGLSIIEHLFITVAMYITFAWDFAPARAFIIPYYVCMPLLYIPFINNKYISYLSIGGTAIAMLFLCYKAWLYEGFFYWLIHIAGWGFSAYCCLIAFVMHQEGRCPNCGHFCLTMRGVTPKYKGAVEHFRNLDPEGRDIREVSLGDPQIDPKDIGKECCPYCMNYTKE